MNSLTLRRVRGGAATLAALGLVASGAHAAAATPMPADDAAQESAASRHVTLVTGDVASVDVDASGTVLSAGLAERDGVATTFQDANGLYVFPDGVLARVDAGELDRELFNVTRLVADGYDDAARDTLSVIVDDASAADVAGTEGIEVTRELTALDGIAVTIDKSDAADAWQTLSAAVSGDSTLWLDRALHASVEPAAAAAEIDVESPTVPLTGAGAAHDRGLDGSGVTVAVLDSGYDTAHPDLAGRVIGSETFVFGGSVEDRNGHGTHTASTIAGTGSASEGLYAGMAPGADLLIGKVLGDDGSGASSGVVAGMQWAVDQGADIVSMSLGAEGLSCSSPEVEAVRALSDQALFVIAAGNASVSHAISTPGCAPEALTVGAIDRAGETAGFSTRGPVFGGSTAKPDIASQGVDVVAARAGGRDGSAYASYSGTSMATPHVAGGAALVLQDDPELTPTQLKDVLTSSARDSDASVLDEGAGHLDVAQALDQAVTAPANLVLADLAYPQDEAVDGAISLVNTSDSEVTMAIRADDLIGDDRETKLAGSFLTLGAKRITIPANGVAEVPVTIDPRATIKDLAYGTVTARLLGDGDDGVRVSVPISIDLEAPSYDLTVDVADRFGQPAVSPSSVAIVDAAHGQASMVGVRDGQAHLRVRAGEVTVVANVMTRDDSSNAGLVQSLAVMSEQRLRVDDDMTISFDAQDAKQISWKTDRESESYGYGAGFTYDMSGTGRMMAALAAAPRYVEELYGASRGGTDPDFAFVAATRAFAPSATFETATGGFDAFPAALAPEFDGSGSAPLVRPDGDVDGAVALVEVETTSGLSRTSTDLAERGAVGMVVTVPGSTGRFNPNVYGAVIPVVVVTGDTGERLAAEADAGAIVTWDGTSVETSPYAYNLVERQSGRVSPGTIRVRDADLQAESGRYHSQGDERFLYTDTKFSLPGVSSTYASGTPAPVLAPQERTDLFTASPDVAWTSIVAPGYVNSGGAFDGPRSRTAGEGGIADWLKAPIGQVSPTDGTSMFDRQGGQLTVSVPHYGDAGGHDAVGAYPDRRWFDMWIDGERAIPSAGTYDLPEATATIRAHVDWSRPAGFGVIDWNTGLAYATDWEFTTTGGDAGALDALIPHVDVPVDLANRVPADEAVTVALAASSDAAPRVDAELSDVQVWFAIGDEQRFDAIADDAWQQVEATGAGSAWQADVPGAPAGSFVHLRVEMTGADGDSSVTQTMVRAYGVS
ncbi:S8 family serine peptidase [Microbacterium sp. G2-8]|uniref:S8 family serine peptidase n=1 Tax=Microbacterium sp. G2-8 TaxID=2842454 RepID=UPI001C8AA697|nr:S8 family serine peptidase [Microbacterium sp. G2-8]